MSVFDSDVVIPFDEYVKTIYNHATQYGAKSSNPSTLTLTAEELLKKVDVEYKQEHFDSAYYYAIKCLQLFDTDKTPVNLRVVQPTSKKYMKAALDYVDALKKGPLLHHYDNMIERIKNYEPERKRVVAMQMQKDGPLSEEDEYKRRQNALLLAENQRTEELRRQINGLNTSSNSQVAVAPLPPSAIHSNNNVSVLPPAQYNQNMPLAQNGMPPLFGDNYYNTNNNNNNNNNANNTSNFSAGLAPLGRNRTNSVPAPADEPCRKLSYTVWNFNVKPLTNVPFPRRGLINLGNTCYMNSVMQMLNATPLANLFLGNEYIDQLCNKEGKYSRVVNAFAYIIRELRRAECPFAVSCSPFKKAVGDVYEPFDNSRQQDANEFLRVLLDALHTGMNANANNKTPLDQIDNAKGTDEALARVYWWQYAQRNQSFIVDTCGFQERSLLKCPQCGYQTRSFTATFGVEIPIPRTGKSQNVEDCLASYCQPEVLEDSSLYLCSGCNKKVNATKQLQFYTTPQVLFITLKRFRTYGDFSTAAKVNDPILFGEYLDVKPFMCSEFSKTKYQLVGVVNHQGNMHGGHYTADAMGGDGAWFRFSDDVVQYATQPDACLGYILCYQRL